VWGVHLRICMRPNPRLAIAGAKRSRESQALAEEPGTQEFDERILSRIWNEKRPTRNVGRLHSESGQYSHRFWYH
jgi:hypothetical protein